MTARRPVVAAVAVALALAISAVDTVAARWWRATAATLKVHPEAGAQRLADLPGLELPEAVRRSRRLPARDLAQALPATALRALERVGQLQRAWFVVDPTGYKNSARAAMIDGRMAEASEWLNAALHRDPTSASLHRLRAMVRWREGRRVEALDDLAEAAALAPGLRTPTLELTPEDERWVRLEGLERALERYPRQRVRTLLELVEQLRAGGHEVDGRELLGAESFHPDIELKLAAWDRDAGAFGEASRRLEDLAQRRLLPSPIRARAWSELAMVRDLAGDAEGAEEAARTALAMAPGSPSPYLALAGLAERRGDWQLALDQLRRAWGLEPANARLLVRVAAAAERAGELADARLALERAVELEPDVADHAVRLVDFLIRNGQLLDATVALSRALDRFPTEPRLMRQLERVQRAARR